MSADASSTQTMNMLEAINHTLIAEMERDERVMVFGEDVGGSIAGFVVIKCQHDGAPNGCLGNLVGGLLVGERCRPDADGWHSDMVGEGVGVCTTGVGSARVMRVSVTYVTHVKANASDAGRLNGGRTSESENHAVGTPS